MSDVGQLIRTRRRELDMTQSQLSKAAGICISHVCHIEKGIRNPSVDALQAIAKALDVPAGGFLAEATLTAVADLRDRFAGMAMQGAFTSPLASSQEEKDYIAKHAYAMADAMLKARSA